MNISTLKSKDLTVVAVSGQIGREDTPRLEERLHRLVEEGREHIIMELSGVDLLSRDGVQMLEACAQDLREEGGDLYLACISAGVRGSLALSGCGVLGVFESVGQAASAISKKVDADAA